MSKRGRRRFACLKRNQHDSLVDRVQEHCNLYLATQKFNTYAFYDYKTRKGRSGEIDLIGLRRGAITIYEIKGTHTPRGYKKAIRQLFRARDYIRQKNQNIRINLVYVTGQGAARIRNNPKPFLKVFKRF